MDAHVTVSLTPGQANFEPRKYLRLTVTDASSNLGLVDVKLLAEDVFNLLRGAEANRITGELGERIEGIPAEVPEPDTYARLIGRTIHRAIFPLHTRDEEAARAWLSDHATLLPPAGQVGLRRSRDGRYAVQAVFYFDASECASGRDQQVIAAIRDAALSAPDKSAPRS